MIAGDSTPYIVYQGADEQVAGAGSSPRDALKQGGRPPFHKAPLPGVAAGMADCSRFSRVPSLIFGLLHWAIAPPCRILAMRTQSVLCRRERAGYEDI